MWDPGTTFFALPRIGRRTVFVPLPPLLRGREGIATGLSFELGHHVLQLGELLREQASVLRVLFRHVVREVELSHTREHDETANEITSNEMISLQASCPDLR